MYRTIKAKFATTCKRCGGPIPVGGTMRYGGKGRTYHLAAKCPGAPAAAPDDDAIALAYENRHTTWSDNDVEAMMDREAFGGDY